MAAVVDAGVEAIALADHNSADWIEVMVEAGHEAGVIVFPGVEVTTGSGADGVHLVIVGDPSRTKSDFEQILLAVCGYGPDHPRFNPQSGNPASAPRTGVEILDDLPDGYLVIAPHAFNDNGIASSDTVSGDLRWKLLHHDRLNALDIGDLRELTDPASWHSRFAHRELNHFPCLDRLAFVSTSDAYRLDRIGARWTWIRMSEPTLEGLRQAFLDREARIICDWDSQGGNPNEVSHAWVESISLSGLAISDRDVDIRFHPGLNVLIGGRGSGKSTIVAGLRARYGDVESLPAQTRTEAAELLDAVFPSATVTALHRLAHSGEEQIVVWRRSTNSETQRRQDGEVISIATDFKVRVINQKELFERAAHSTEDRFSTSRNLLAMIDDALATGSGGPGGPAAFSASLTEAQTAWIGAARAHQAEIVATSQRDVVSSRVGELERQVAAFDSEESRARRQRNDRFLTQRDVLAQAIDELEDLLSSVQSALDERAQVDPEPVVGSGGSDAESAVADDYNALNARLVQVESSFRTSVAHAVEAARAGVQTFEEERTTGAWGLALVEANLDAGRYRDELAQLGVDGDEYDRVREQLAAQARLLAELDERIGRLPDLREAAADAWSAIEDRLDERRRMRQGLLDEVATRSGMLRFSLSPRADIPQWVRTVRDLLNLRADGFISDVPQMARWIWSTDVTDSERERRAELWRAACVTGAFGDLAPDAGMRREWVDRLSQLDEVLRARLGSTQPDDSVEMRFLVDGGDRDVETDWKPLTAGSPGQRSAAMLSFVLHHGVDPLVLDQPEDDLDAEWITDLVVRQLRTSRWTRQLMVVTHNANIPVNADAERVIVMETHSGSIRVRRSDDSDGESLEHAGGLEEPHVRLDVQQIMEGGVPAFVRRELRYNNELNSYRSALKSVARQSGD